MSRKTLDPKDPAEVIVLTWDYTAALDATETITGAQTSTALLSGADDAPIDLTLSGSPIIAGGQIKQAVTGGQAGANHLVRCQATLAPSGRILVLAANLPVRTA